jgi:hypothetical protein
VTNPGGLTSFILSLDVKSRSDLMARINAAYPRLNQRERDIAFSIVAREIRRITPILAARARRDPEHTRMIAETIVRHRALLRAMKPEEQAPPSPKSCMKG